MPKHDYSKGNGVDDTRGKVGIISISWLFRCRIEGHTPARTSTLIMGISSSFEKGSHGEIDKKSLSVSSNVEIEDALFIQRIFRDWKKKVKYGSMLHETENKNINMDTLDSNSVYILEQKWPSSQVAYLIERLCECEV